MLGPKGAEQLHIRQSGDSLARDGRIRDAVKAGAEWLNPTPVEVIPGRRSPVAAAGRAQEAGS